MHLIFISTFDLKLRNRYEFLIKYSEYEKNEMHIVFFSANAWVAFIHLDSRFILKSSFTQKIFPSPLIILKNNSLSSLD